MNAIYLIPILPVASSLFFQLTGRFFTQYHLGPVYFRVLMFGLIPMTRIRRDRISRVYKTTIKDFGFFNLAYIKCGNRFSREIIVIDRKDPLLTKGIVITPRFTEKALMEFRQEGNKAWIR